MKKLLTFAFAVAAATMAQASYLYWQTSAETTFNGHEILGYNLYANSGTGFTRVTTGILDADGDAVSLTDNGLAGGYQYAIDVSKYSDTSSFYVEVIGYDEAAFGAADIAGKIGETAPTTYADLYSKGYILTSGTALTIPNAWTGGPVAAPEPTSAMLMLLGMAGLALKRRKA